MKLPDIPLKHVVAVASFALAAMLLAAIAGYRLELKQLGLTFEPASGAAADARP